MLTGDSLRAAPHASPPLAAPQTPGYSLRTLLLCMDGCMEMTPMGAMFREDGSEVDVSCWWAASFSAKCSTHH